MNSPATQQHFIVGNNADPIDDEINAQAAIRAAGWWDRANWSEAWPVTSEQAADLLSAGGEYDVDSAGLHELVGRRLLAPPSQGEADESEWSATDLMAASALLEARQQWKPTPSQHDPKKHGTTLLLEQARRDDEVEQIVSGADQARFDTRHLLALLLACQHHEARQKVISLLRATLEVEHGVVV